MNTTAAAPKKVSKKSTTTTTAAAPAAPAPVATPAPVVAAPPAPAPVAEPVAAATPSADATTSLTDEIAALHTQLTAIRDAATNALSALKRVAKRAAQDVKDARKNRRRARSEPAEGEQRKPSNFEIPVPISDELSGFLGAGKGAQMSRAEVTIAINKYMNEKGLRVKHDITPDAALRKLLGVTADEKLTIFNIQKYMSRHYVKPAPKA